MQDELIEVMLLQTEYMSSNTPSMQRRGLLIRTLIADQLRDWLPELMAAAGVEDLAVEGRDGTGLKSEVPWVRVYSTSRSPSSTLGWYVVYLFSAAGDRVYLSLNQGTTQWTSGEFRARPRAELEARVAWAQELLGLAEAPGFTSVINLETRGSLGRGYEIGNVLAAEYLIDSLPDDEALHADLLRASGWLGQIYRVTDEGLGVPGETAPEVADAEAVADVVAGRARSRRRLLLTSEERRLIEKHAVKIATAYLEDELGWDVVTDVGDTQSYDLDARRGTDRLFVEVKGTTSRGAEVVLTRNEVHLHREQAPHNALAVVHSIRLDRSVSPSTVSGGALDFRSPWNLEDRDLTPLSYQYRTGLG